MSYEWWVIFFWPYRSNNCILCLFRLRQQGRKTICLFPRIIDVKIAHFTFAQSHAWFLWGGAGGGVLVHLILSKILIVVSMLTISATHDISNLFVPSPWRNVLVTSATLSTPWSSKHSTKIALSIKRSASSLPGSACRARRMFAHVSRFSVVRAATGNLGGGEGSSTMCFKFW